MTTKFPLFLYKIQLPGRPGIPGSKTWDPPGGYTGSDLSEGPGVLSEQGGQQFKYFMAPLSLWFKKPSPLLKLQLYFSLHEKIVY